MIGNKIKALLDFSNISADQAYKKLNIAQSAFSRKVQRNTFKTEELIKLADLTNTKLCFTNEKNEIVIFFDINDVVD